MKTHKLKTWPKYFEQIALGQKTFECRKNDRDFQPGDIVILEEYVPETKAYTGVCMTFQIGYVLTHEDWHGLLSSYCTFSLIPYQIDESPWISVEERKPETGEVVDIFTSNYRRVCFVEWLDPLPHFDPHTVTHWMPIPDDPQHK